AATEAVTAEAATTEAVTTEAAATEAVTAAAGGTPVPVAPAGFRPPPYPYERLGPIRSKAAALTGGMVDLSVGSPCDRPSPAVLAALASPDERGATRGYPSSAGSPTARQAAADWMARRLGATVDPSLVALCIGTKEFVGGLPGWLHLRDPSRDTVLYPELSYPTYEMGALLAGLRAVRVPVDDEFRLRLSPDAVSEEDAARALVLWVNSPGNPAGQLDDLAAAADWGQQRGILVASDECYAELTWKGPPQTVIGHGGGPSGTEGVLAVHSLSKRSNLAGLRFGWYTGDPEIVRFLRDVRQHGGFMVPGAVQLAGVAALADQRHADIQRERYSERLARLQQILAAVGVEAPLPEGGIYLWAPAPDGDAWALTARLAAEAGLVVSPGEFYGPAGSGYIRVAAVAPMDRIELVASRVGLA
ncbi:MAG TPA: pyridoxal phosphate-dependent aminotransferase, partial [Acidimicrobiales bacterium]|nr:pyridoxal phosphate-dependent aminotransferase [Acidimicrobiales bacterium]